MCIHQYKVHESILQYLNKSEAHITYCCFPHSLWFLYCVTKYKNYSSGYNNIIILDHIKDVNKLVNGSDTPQHLSVCIFITNCIQTSQSQLMQCEMEVPPVNDLRTAPFFPFGSSRSNVLSGSYFFVF